MLEISQFEISNRNEKPIGVYLVEAGLITPAQVEMALDDQKVNGRRLGEILANRGWIKLPTIEYLIKKVVLQERRAVENKLSDPQKNRSQNLTSGGQASLAQRKDFDSLLLSAVPSRESKVLDKLVYTSFAGVGFRSLISPHVTTEIQQAFIQQVVYRHWDAYHPPSSGYRAAYLHQVTLEHTLFGWLYYDEVDDLGRRVPYFLCYYYAEPLHAVQLENIFICLQKGPVALIDPQSFPATLEAIVAPDLWSYQPARIGVAIPSGVREYSHIALEQRKLLDLFLPIEEPQIVTNLNAQMSLQQSDPLQPLVTATPMPQASDSGQDTISGFQGTESQPQVSSYISDASVPTSPNKSTLLIGLKVGIASALALIGAAYGLLQWQYWQESQQLKKIKTLEQERVDLKWNDSRYVAQEKELQ